MRLWSRYFIGAILGLAFTILCNFLMLQSGIVQISWNGFQEKNIISTWLNYKLKKNVTSSFLNLIAPIAYQTANNYPEDDTELADILSKEIRILCFILTQPKNHQSKARAVRETWGQRCNVFYFVSTEKVVLEEDPSVTTVVYEGKESKSSLWSKTKVGFKHAYDNHFDDVDWFVKADDDTYLVMENMRMFLLDKDTSLSAFFGHRFVGYRAKSEYISGGSGYILSKEALRRLAEEAFDPKTRCNRIHIGREDMEMTRCLQSVKVEIGDARDAESKPRFLQTTLANHLNARNPKLDNDVASKDSVAYGKNCCSHSIIGMHYVDANMMRVLEFLIYNVHPFGINSKFSGVNYKDEILFYLRNKIVNQTTKNLNPKFPIVQEMYLT